LVKFNPILTLLCLDLSAFVDSFVNFLNNKSLKS
jgi:hypothetical protein